MRGIVNLIVAIICLVNIVYHFIRSPETQTIFGFEVPNVVYLLFWGFIMVSAFMSFLKDTRKK